MERPERHDHAEHVSARDICARQHHLPCDWREPPSLRVHEGVRREPRLRAAAPARVKQARRRIGIRSRHFGLGRGERKQHGKYVSTQLLHQSAHHCEARPFPF